MGIISFDAIVNPDCTTLILGTMPGILSLEQQQYYGHPDNVFWDIMLRILLPSITEEQIDNLTYQYKKELLLSNRIALWDVLQYCDRKGSLDSKITNEIKNDFKFFFKQYPQITRILFNGQKPEKYFHTCFKNLITELNLVTITLPSTSPSHSLNTFKKLRIWRNAFKV